MRRVFLLLMASLALAACSGDDGPPDTPEPECGYHDDCPTGQVCFEGQCEGTASCSERKNCRNVPICEGLRCFCDEDSRRCLPACETDLDCPSDGHCLDGTCERYPVDFDAWPRPESGARGGLRVGLATVPLDFPMGVSMAGYGSRTGPRTPYQDSLGGSHSWFDRPDVRAMVFEDGKETFALLRTPTCWSTDFLLARTAEKVAMRTGVNLHDRIVQSAPHSHSHPARYWHLVVGLGFGFFGYGEFNGEVFERMTDSFADAIELAMMNTQPARFGYTVLDDFDPENRIHRDRRRQNDELPGYLKKDDRMVLMRVDDTDGNPLALLSNFGLHGTIFGGSNPTITGDAGGGIEMELTRLASERYGRPVTGFFLQGNAGDVSPSGDDLQHNDFERIQVLGRRVWAVVEPAFDAIETSAQVPVGIVTDRVPISHDLLGYGEGAFYDEGVTCESAPDYFRYGAFQCVEGVAEDSDPATRFEDGDLNCVFSVECLTDGFPVPQFQKTTLTVVRLGSLALATMPGEPVSQFGRDASDRVKAAIDGVTDAAVLGYSQDHHFYLLNEDDWLQGGYEPSRDIWGWKLGPFLVDNSVRIATELAKEPEDRMIERTNVKPMYWPADDGEEWKVVPLTPSDAPETITLDVPAEHPRMTELVFEWQGGHPGTDLPRVTLERDDGDGFTPVTYPGGLPYDDAGFNMMVRYIGDCDRSQCEGHGWRVRWQDGRDVPLGTYRLAVEGRYFDGSATQAYALTSRSFELVASRDLQVLDVALAGGALEAVVLEPPQVELVEDGEARAAEDNAFFLRSVDVPADLGAPLPAGTTLAAAGRVGGVDVAVSAEVSVSPRLRRRLTGYTADGAPTYADERERPTSRVSLAVPGLDALPAGDHFVELTLTDPLGNAGTFTATITK